MHLPDGLEGELRLLLGDEYGRFIESCETPTRETYRVNTIKAVTHDFPFRGEAVPWCPAGYYSRSPVGPTVEHFQGLVYVQEAASMIPAEILGPSEGDVVLDLAAAPGSKTTHLAALMGNKGCIVANEVDYGRLKSLRFNLNRMGVVNSIVTCMDGSRFSPDIRFDKVLLDAPCSNVGQLRDNPEALTTWNKAKVERSCALQKRLMDSAVEALKDDGVLVYSTCTFSPEENEGIVDYAVEEHALRVEPIAGDFKYHRGVRRWGGCEYSIRVEKAARFYPHDNDTGGFFVARMRK